MRFHPVIQKVKELVISKKLGKTLHVRACSGFYLPFWHPNENYRDFYMSSRADGGGVLLDTSHEIDYLTWLFGDVDNVFGTIKQVSNLDIYADDLTRIMGQTKDKIDFDIHLDLLQFNEERSLKIISSDSVLKASLTTGEIQINYLNGKSDEIKVNIVGDQIYQKAYDQFFGVDKFPPSELATLSDGFKVLEVIEALRLSSATRSQINLPMWQIN